VIGLSGSDRRIVSPLITQTKVYIKAIEKDAQFCPHALKNTIMVVLMAKNRKVQQKAKNFQNVFRCYSIKVYLRDAFILSSLLSTYPVRNR